MHLTDNNIADILNASGRWGYDLFYDDKWFHLRWLNADPYHSQGAS